MMFLIFFLILVSFVLAFKDNIRKLFMLGTWQKGYLAYYSLYKSIIIHARNIHSIPIPFLDFSKFQYGPFYRTFGVYGRSKQRRTDSSFIQLKPFSISFQTDTVTYKNYEI